MRKKYKMKAIHLPSRQMSNEVQRFLIDSRTIGSEWPKLPWDVYEEGREDVIILRMMEESAFEQDDETFPKLPKELKDLLHFMKEKEIDIIYCDTLDGWTDSHVIDELTLKTLEKNFVNDERLPIYDDNDEAIPYAILHEKLS